MPVKKKIKHAFNRFSAGWAKILHEKVISSNGFVVKYMFFSNDCDQLVVSFPACAPSTSRYNYVRTLKRFKADKLFLLDDYAENHQGCYLVKDEVESMVCNLIKQIVEKGHYTKIVFIGSSKGGYSALNFSFFIPNVDVVIGAPQYHLGSYLNKPNTMPNLRYLLDGNIDAAGIERLDNRLRNIILCSDVKPSKVYIHYSNCELTYDRHVRWLLDDLKSAGILVCEDVEKYPSHDDMVSFFPPYLDKQLTNILS